MAEGPGLSEEERRTLILAADALDHAEEALSAGDDI
jgi:hypothetical protein